jgi:hypothetical protein
MVVSEKKDGVTASGKEGLMRWLMLIEARRYRRFFHRIYLPASQDFCPA